MLPNNSLFINTTHLFYFFDFLHKQSHRGTTLELLYCIKNLIAKWLTYTLDKVLHFLLRVKQVINVKEKISVHEKPGVLRRKALLEVGNEVRILEILADMIVSLNY